MKIIQVIPGSGGSFYCQNCVRDASVVMAMRKLGHDVVLAPMYLPLYSDEPGIEDNSPVFYGAVNVYLKQTFALFRRAPRWLERMLDAPSVLANAARKAGSVRASGLEDMTLSMLDGEQGRQASELERMIDWLKTEKPDVVHLSNALLLGMAKPIKQALGCMIACSLQDEDVWIDSMGPSAAARVWKKIREKALEVDCFTPVSQFYADVMKERISIPSDKLHVVHLGVNLVGYEPAAPDKNPPTIGYLSRMARTLGLEALLDAFLVLKKDDRIPGLRLRVTGGQTGDDLEFLDELRQRIRREGVNQDVDFVTSFERDERIRFLQSLSVLSVPVPKGEAFGTYMIEAMGCGVPVVQPSTGSFPEIVNATGGGVLYNPADSHALADALATLLLDPARLRKLGQQGRQAVLRDFSIEKMAERMVEAYSGI